MVIDWESSVPVWSDTLQPAGTDLASVIQRAHAANDQSKSSSKKGASPNSQSGKPISPAVTPPSRKQLPQPPRPPPSGARVTDVSTSSAQNVSLPSPTSSIHGHERPTEDPVNRSPHSVSDSGHGNESAPWHLGSEVAMASTETSLAPRQAQKSAEAESLPDTEVDELHAAAIEFLTQSLMKIAQILQALTHATHSFRAACTSSRQQLHRPPQNRTLSLRNLQAEIP